MNLQDSIGLDTENVFGVFMALFIMLIFLTLVLTIIDAAYYYTKATDNANDICILRGYDQYSEFSRVPLTDRPVGVKCEYVSKSMIDTNVNIP